MSETVQTVDELKSVFAAKGLSCSDDDIANLIRKDRLIKDIERLLNEGHTRSEIDKTVRQILAEKAKNEVN